MDEGTVRELAERHAEQLRDGNLTGAFSDLTDEAKSQLEPYVLNFPSPVERAEMVSLSLRPEGYVALLEVAGGGREVKLETTWADVQGRPMITRVAGIGEP